MGVGGRGHPGECTHIKNIYTHIHTSTCTALTHVCVSFSTEMLLNQPGWGGEAQDGMSVKAWEREERSWACSHRPDSWLGAHNKDPRTRPWHPGGLGQTHAQTHRNTNTYSDTYAAKPTQVKQQHGIHRLSLQAWEWIYGFTTYIKAKVLYCVALKCYFLNTHINWTRKTSS